MGPWNCLGNKALTDAQYSPDFDAVAVAPVRVLRIRRQAFLAAMEATSLQPVVDYQVRDPHRRLHACRALKKAQKETSEAWEWLTLLARPALIVVCLGLPEESVFGS